MSSARPLLAATALMGLLALSGFGSSDANAQQIFRSTGPDGRITFSDKPPVEPGVRASAAKVVPATGTTVDNSALPFELREAANRYPVTLYTGSGCAPCGQGRNLLTGRGVPFSEKTVNSNEDIEALKRMAGAPSLPFLTIGGQQLKGFSEIEWTQFLDAAGYPKSSQLPATYHAPAAAPLVAAQQLATPAAGAPAEASPVATPAPAAAAPADNPAGIRF